MRVGIHTDYARVSLLAGPVFMTRFFKERLEALGHEVQLIGPEDPDTQPGEVPEGTVLCPALTFPHYKGFYVPLPLEPQMFMRPWNLDVVLGQTNSLFLHFGVWLREYHGVPTLATNTIHLPSYTQHILSDEVLLTPFIRETLDWRMGLVERHFAENLYNHTDGLIVLSEHLVSYWRERGVTAPIHVIPRPIRPEVFDRMPSRDPIPARLARGGRVLCVCRHAREKCVDRVVRNFAAYVDPVVEGASLTLVGDGPAHGELQELAKRLGVADRVHFAGMVPQGQLVDYYRNADVYAYASLSETFGCVVSEALWCGLPVVAFDDRMGVAHQVKEAENGHLVPTQGFADPVADIAFGRAIARLLTNWPERMRLSQNAAAIAHRECSPERIMAMTLAAMEAAKEHRKETLPRPAIERGVGARAITTFRNVHPWGYQNSAFWMLGQFFRPRAPRVPDVLGQALKMPSPALVPAPAPSRTLPAAVSRRVSAAAGL